MPEKIMLVGEPMGLFIANEEGPLDAVSSFPASVSSAEFNVAIGISRLEHKVGSLTKLGMDSFGIRIKRMMEQNGISSELVSLSDERYTGFMLKSKVLKGDLEISYFRKNSSASGICCSYIDKINF